MENEDLTRAGSPLWELDIVEVTLHAGGTFKEVSELAAQPPIGEGSVRTSDKEPLNLGRFMPGSRDAGKKVEPPGM